MCPIRKRAKSIIQQKTTGKSNLLVSTSLFTNQIIQNLSIEQNNQNIQFDAFLFKKQENPYVPKLVQLWTAYHISRFAYLHVNCPVGGQVSGQQENSVCRHSNEGSQIHTISLENQAQNQQNWLSEVKTTISMQAQGSTFQCQNSMSQILSISNSVISVNSMQI